MSPKSIFILGLSIVLLGAGTSGGEELNGILGRAVAFRVKTSPPIKSISWSKIAGSKSEVLAVVTFTENCGLLIPDPAYQQRVRTSWDCRELHLGYLKNEDAGRFAAGIVTPDGEKVEEFFDLDISWYLLDSDMRVTCTPDGTKNGTWHLSCSTQPWEDRVNISWTSPAHSTHPTPGSSVIILQDLDHNFTCTAENLVSRASRRVSSKQVCAGRLLDSEIRVTCTQDGAANGGWRLNCSKEPWEDGVKLSWSSDLQSKDSTFGSSLTNLDLHVTCTAENLVSKASKTVSLKRVCAEHTETLRTETRLPLWALLCLSKLGSLLLLGCFGLILRVKPRKERRQQ